LNPIIGLANNGDFQRFSLKFGVDFPFNVWDQNDLEHRNMSLFARVFNGYVIVAPQNTGFFSSYEFIGWLSRGVSTLLSKTGLYDIRYLGGVCASLVLVSTYSIFKTARTYKTSNRLFIIICLTLLLTDPFYIQYYNCFFTEQAFFCYGLLFVAAFLWNCSSKSSISLVIEIISLTLLGFSKSQNIVVIFPAAIAILIQQCFHFCKRERIKFLVASTCLIVVMCVTMISVKARPAEKPISDNKVVTYNTIMGRLLRISDDPFSQLQAMGFSDEEIQIITGNIGNSAFVNTFPADNPKIYDKLSSMKTELEMIIREPALVFKAMADIQNDLYRDVYYLANFQAEEYATQKTSLLSFHNDVLSKIAPRNYVVLFFCMAIITVYSIFVAFKNRDSRGLIAGIISSSVMMMYFVVAIGDGWENIKHLYVVNILSGIAYGYLAFKCIVLIKGKIEKAGSSLKHKVGERIKNKKV